MKMRTLHLTALLAGLLFWAACGSLPEIQSQWRQKDQSGIPTRSALTSYDKGSRIAYQLRNDEESFYLDLQISDRITQMKVLRSGIRIGVDTTGKKKEGLWFQYPYLGNDSRLTKEELEQLRAITADASGNKMRQAVEALPRDAAFGIGGEIGQFSLDAIDAVFGARITMIEAGVMHYSIGIPFKRVPHSASGLREWSIGISMDGIQMPGNLTSTGGAQTAGAQGGGGYASTKASLTLQVLGEQVKIWFQPDWASQP